MKKKEIKIKEVKTNYLELGKGNPIVLIHGGGGSSAIHSWGRNIEELAKKQKIIAPDLPGYGESEKQKINYTTNYYVEFLSHFLDRVCDKKPILVGNSMGGAISLKYSLNNPDKVKKLILVDSYGLGKKVFLYNLLYLFLNFPYLEEILWRVQQIIDKHWIEWAFFSWLINEVQWSGFKTCFVDSLSDLKVPTLVIHGEKDRIIPVSWAKRANELIKNSEIEIFKNAGHRPQRGFPKKFNELLLNFI